MSWKRVRVDAAWLVLSALSVLFMLATDNKVVAVVGTVVVVADLARWIHWLVVETEMRQR